jgi:hypothetical protein
MNPSRQYSSVQHQAATAIFACFILSFATLPIQAQHVHVNAGAIDTIQGAQLYFPNGNAFDANAGYNVYLTFTNSGSFANLYQGAGVTFTALASTLDNGGPAFGHAADGAFLQLQFVSMSGPPGGEFGVWMQSPASPGVSSQLFSLPVGTDGGTSMLALSENDGSPGSDPYGHIHGRTFAATKPGLYKLGCRIIDTSSNGAGGGPVHPPSNLYYFYFQAGLTISSWAEEPGTFSVTFGTQVGVTYHLESTSQITATVWESVAGPFTGDNHLRTVVGDSDISPRFFRIRSN